MTDSKELAKAVREFVLRTYEGEPVAIAVTRDTHHKQLQLDPEGFRCATGCRVCGQELQVTDHRSQFGGKPYAWTEGGHHLVTYDPEDNFGLDRFTICDDCAESAEAYIGELEDKGEP